MELYLKLETPQPIGSFKMRGAVNVLRQLQASERNAALGVAYAARQAGVPCSVMVMDTAAPPAASLQANRPVYFDG